MFIYASVPQVRGPGSRATARGFAAARPVAAYLFTGGFAAGAALLAAGRGRHAGATRFAGFREAFTAV